MHRSAARIIRVVSPGAALLMLFALVPSAGAVGVDLIAQSTAYEQVEAAAAQPATGADVLLPPGYQIRELASGFSSAIAMAVAPNGDLYVLNSGFPSFAAGAQPGPVEIFRVTPAGQRTMVYSSATAPEPKLEPVALGIAVLDEDNIFVNDGAYGLNRVRRDGRVERLVRLPVGVDHNADHITIGRDGKLYWGQGSATNSGVVGPDNELLTGWLLARPQNHDIPCRDVMLTGVNWTSENILTPDPDDMVETGPFLPFGTPARPGQVIPGQLPCTSSVMRVNPDGTGLELVAWGFRNPFGLAFSPEDSPLKGALVVTNNGADVRGSRPIESDGDDLFVIQEGGWYGWPDYLDELPVTEPRFAPVDTNGERASVEQTLWVPARGEAISAIVHFEKGISADGLDFSRSDAFGYVHDAFIASWGNLGFGRQPSGINPGFWVYRVHFRTNEEGVLTGASVEIWARNREFGPASQTGQDGFEHPVDVKFSPDGRTMYVLDFGVVGGPGTGRIWAITRSS